MTGPIRLNRYLASCGVASRRRADELIAAGLVTVGGEVVKDAGRRVEPGQIVTVEGERVRPERHAYYMANKPRAVVTTVRDELGRRTVMDLVEAGERLFPVGRLDADTTGLILLTNDGELAQRLAHPSNGVPKTYLARVRGRVSKDTIEALRQGVELDDGLTAPAKVRWLGEGDRDTSIELTIREGRNRQVRRMFEAVGHPVLRLERTRYGPLALGSLKRGKSRPLTPDEITALQRA